MSVTAPSGFRAAGITAGMKKNGQPDLALVVNDGPHPAAAAVFTSNRFAAAPVQWSRAAMARNARLGTAPRAVVLNSAGANACTGAAGFADTESTASKAAQLLQLPLEQILVCSTGLIGDPLPMDKMLPGVDAAYAQLSNEGGPDAAAANMTTDTHPKYVSMAHDTFLGPVIVGGMAKGAGMLAPGLATMLVVVSTDVKLDSATAQRCLEAAVGQTFNRIDSDGCMSTNDTVILMASGASEIALSEAQFTALLTAVCEKLALELISDAEGASHDIRIDVANCATEHSGVEVARAIARSNLFKTAIFGNDPNWGRILSAMGTLSPEVAPYDPSQVDVTINGVTVCRGGGVGEDRSLVDLSARAVNILVDLHAGDQQVSLWTNDLTHEYIHENSAYSS
ncbi:MAG: bifunctional glutamate N-acetyltransferase/amino-acid acetyltransferase ArgJ [Propionibacteriaceae bacterium]|jgi:glutamate N-acetyltransferase/amino-acid N-acetyltransferase|nr:bifunctional glutamate N-acetyltransferase/amino-acid acetyltransferase ArgJ [Propionibacteriaceae bacterium]